MTTFGDIVASPDLVMGAKAVFGPVKSHMLCFGSRGDKGSNAYYSKPRTAAQRAVTQPWVICIGGGRNVRDNLGGCVLNLVKVGPQFGDTEALTDADEARRLAQWPVAVALEDVWSFDGFPHLVRDLGMPDRRILENAMDGILRRDDAIEAAFLKLRDWPIRPAHAAIPANIAPVREPTLITRRSRLATIEISSEEGQASWQLQRKYESDRQLKKAAKQLNADRNDGRCKCEACGFTHSDSALFDAHHPTPLAVGVRMTLASHLQILCPTCHRRAHRNSPNALYPFSLEELRNWCAEGRP